MQDTWYVSYQTPRRSLAERPQARQSKRFKTEIEAKQFAREKLNEGLVVIAGTINPHSPKRLITPSNLEDWLDS